MTTIFFSWQADTPSKIGRGLVREALDAAVKQLAGDVEIQEALRRDLKTDSDTQGIAGSPSIVETILEKIDAAAVFVADLTFTGRRIDGGAPGQRPTPNPNVLIEYGWACKALGRSKVVSVMNVAYGAPSQADMPFDLVHVRHPIQFDCCADATPEARKAATRGLAAEFARAIKQVLKQTLPQPESVRFEARKPLTGESYFRDIASIGTVHSRVPMPGGARPIFLHPRHTMWLRLMPVEAIGEDFTNLAIEEALWDHELPAPLSWDPDPSLRRIRGPDGYGSFIDEGGDSTPAVFYVFASGEVWSVDTTHASAGDAVHFDEQRFAECLASSMRVLDRLGLGGRYRWIAGLEGVRDRELHGPSVPHALTPHTFLKDKIWREGEIDSGADAAQALAPFFRAVFDAAQLRWSPPHPQALR